MTTLQEIEMLASLLSRAGMTPIEIEWANTVINKLRAMVEQANVKKTQEDQEVEQRPSEG